MIKDTASASILKTGPVTKIRDLGRIGFAEFGIAQAGPLDQSAYLWVNHLLRNHQNDAVLEITQPGFSIRFDAPTLICLAGAKAQMFFEWGGNCLIWSDSYFGRVKARNWKL